MPVTGVGTLAQDALLTSGVHIRRMMQYREKLDSLSRRLYDKGRMNFISDVALLLVDEVHLLCEDRGPALEAGVVCRLKALGCLPQMQSMHLANLRIVAVSATIPNISDIVDWLGIRPEGCKQYGEEMRPVQIHTIVKGFPLAKNDFLFERSLNEKVFHIVQENWSKKPVLAFCSSRKGLLHAGDLHIG
jgi:ATP-dependent DNA helicase HFM1/MER3